MRIRRGTSSARSEAARINGSHSKGPKTDSGKARSSSNSLKHGLLASRIVLEGREDPAEFSQLRKDLLKQYQPRGPAETMLCEQLVEDYWKLARARSVSHSLTTKNMMFLERLSSQNTRTSNRKLVEVCGSMSASTTQRQIEEIERELRVLKLLDSIGFDEPIPTELEQLSRDTFYADRAFVAHLLVHSQFLRTQKASNQAFSFAGAPDEHCFTTLSSMVLAKRKELKPRLKALKRIRKNEIKLAVCAAPISGGELSEKIQRYETTVQRRFHKNLTLLNQLQRSRRPSTNDGEEG